MGGGEVWVRLAADVMLFDGRLQKGRLGTGRGATDAGAA